jgi:probable rRNA maturation factor
VPDQLPDLSIEVLDQTRRLKPAAISWLTEHIQKAIRHLGAAGEVRVSVIDDAAMAQAHEEFAGVQGTTDVLTFDLADPDLGPPPSMDLELGKLESDKSLYVLDTDILACIDVADRQSQVNPLGESPLSPVEKELLLYVVHGVLHCLGMDDHDEAAAAAMHRVEDAVLTAIGVGPVYSAGREPGLGASG